MTEGRAGLTCLAGTQEVSWGMGVVCTSAAHAWASLADSVACDSKGLEMSFADKDLALDADGSDTSRTAPSHLQLSDEGRGAGW